MLSISLPVLSCKARGSFSASEVRQRDRHWAVGFSAARHTAEGAARHEAVRDTTDVGARARSSNTRFAVTLNSTFRLWLSICPRGDLSDL